jgi:predicted phage terminase large subunit-like protein
MLIEEPPKKNKGGRPKKITPEAVISPELLLAAKRALYKKSYYDFFKAAFPHIRGEQYEPMPHVKRLCDDIQAAGMKLAYREKRDKHKNINVPPRSLKSIVLTVVFPVWLWLHRPNAGILTVTNSASLAQKLLADSTRIIKSAWFQELFGDVFTIEKDTEGVITNNKGGRRKAFGIGSPVLGENADLIILDDVMDTDTASSDAERKAVLAKVSESLIGRFDNKQVGLLINIQQRLHTEDLTGWLQANMPDYFEFIKLPSEAKSEADVYPPEWFAIYENGLLCDAPGRFSREDLTLERARLGSKGYAQQHLQKPVATEGGMFKSKWFTDNVLTEQEFKDKLNGRVAEWQLFIDGAETADAKNDATCMLLCCKLDNQLFIKEVSWIRKAFTDLVKHVTNYLQNSPVRIARVVIEGKSVGKSLLGQLKQDVASIPFVEVQPGRESKATRAESITPFCEGNRVHIIKGTWNQEFIDEVSSFTDGKTGHDDSVDVLVYAVKDAKSGGFWW